MKNARLIGEVVSMETRRKMSRNARRTAKFRANIRKRRRHKMKNTVQLKSKAQKAARNVMIKKLFGDTPYSQMSLGQKQTVARGLEKKKTAIAGLARKLLPRMRKAEAERIRKLMIAKGNEKGPKQS